MGGREMDALLLPGQTPSVQTILRSHNWEERREREVNPSQKLRGLAPSLSANTLANKRFPPCPRREAAPHLLGFPLHISRVLPLSGTCEKEGEFISASCGSASEATERLYRMIVSS